MIFENAFDLKCMIIINLMVALIKKKLFEFKFMINIIRKFNNSRKGERKGSEKDIVFSIKMGQKVLLIRKRKIPFRREPICLFDFLPRIVFV